MKILVIGGAGFIGAAFVRIMHAEGHDIVVFDKLTYAADLKRLKECGEERLSFVKGDIAIPSEVTSIIKKHSYDAIVNFAAETHVDRSIDGPADFIHTNIVGTYNILEAIRTSLASKALPEGFRYLHVSTDEVYGALGSTGAFVEETAYDPRSPYSASKAASDHLVNAWHHTYALPTLITNCGNNYGPWQHLEKLIPKMIVMGIQQKSLPVYGNGQNIREWIDVDDHCYGIKAVLEKGKIGEKYLIGSGDERSNMDVVNQICNVLDKLFPDRVPHNQLIEFVDDRPGHDFRYAIDSSKARSEVQWRHEKSFEEGIYETVKWYVEHEEWWSTILSGNYDGQRLGLLK